MSVRSLNKVMLIGNLTRDPELRYTPAGTAVVSIGLATNRGWTTESGEKREETEFHRIVAWNKLAELCSQLLTKGRKIFVEGRLQTRSWQGQDGTQRQSTEVVIDDMIILDPRRPDMAGVSAGMSAPAPFVPASAAVPAAPIVQAPVSISANSVQDQTIQVPSTVGVSKNTVKSVTGKTDDAKTKDEKPKEKPKQEEENKEDINPDDIPF